MDIIIASNNLHKIVEIKEILGSQFDNIFSLKDKALEIDVEEDGDTFFANAYKKAYEVAKASQMTALSDDSGLVVKSLGGAPGIYSARYAGEPINDRSNNLKLLQDMTSMTDREAHFVSVVVLCNPDGSSIFGEGKTCGTILYEERGESGFGYDPLFLSTEINKTFGEATAKEKNSISHRKRALENLLKKIDF